MSNAVNRKPEDEPKLVSPQSGPTNTSGASEPAEAVPISKEGENSAEQMTTVSDKPANDATEETVPKGPGLVKRLSRFLTRFTLLGIVPVVILLGVGYFMLTTGRFITTENAYVKSDIVGIATSIDGRAIEVAVTDNARVAKGDLLFLLNPRPHEIALDQSFAKIDASTQEIERRRAEYQQVQAEIAEARERITFFQREFDRQQELSQRGVATRARLDEAEFNLATAERAVRVLTQKSRTALADLGGDPAVRVEDHPLYQDAIAEQEQAALRLGYTTVVAPVDGIVSRMHLQPGEWVEAGEPVFGIIATDKIWIEANLKETQLTHIIEGQTVTIEIDAYPDHEWPGMIGSISPATGAEFSLLPPQNASGNWVKVVQRLPIRVDVSQSPDRPLLRAGMTATISIDTERDHSLPVVLGQLIAKLDAWSERLAPGLIKPSEYVPDGLVTPAHAEPQN